MYQNILILIVVVLAALIIHDAAKGHKQASKPVSDAPTAQAQAAKDDPLHEEIIL